MDKKYEVVEYRNCNCGYEFCPGEREFVLFQHKVKEECICFMLKYAFEHKLCIKTKHYENDKNKIDIHIQTLSGLKGVIKLRTQIIK